MRKPLVVVLALVLLVPLRARSQAVPIAEEGIETLTRLVRQIPTSGLSTTQLQALVRLHPSWSLDPTIVALRDAAASPSFFAPGGLYSRIEDPTVRALFVTTTRVQPVEVTCGSSGEACALISNMLDQMPQELSNRIVTRELERLGVDGDVAAFALAYHAEIARLAQLPVAASSPEFVSSGKHPVNFGRHDDHHVREVVREIPDVMDAAYRAGFLVDRSPSELARLSGYTVQLAAIHDIANSLRGFSALARATHPQVAAQAVMSPLFDEAARSLMDSDMGVYLTTHAQELGIDDPERVMREMMTAAMLHSKHSKLDLPPDLFERPELLRAFLIESILEPPEALYARVWGEGAVDGGHRFVVPGYDDFANEAFTWMTDPRAAELVRDFVDGAQLVAMADALRKRGTMLADSSGARVLIEESTGEVVYMKYDAGRLLPSYELTDLYSVGEAALRFTELAPDGSLHVGLVRGVYDDAVAAPIAEGAAKTVMEVVTDVLDRVSLAAGTPRRVVLVRAPDETGAEATLTDALRAQLLQADPTLEVDIVTSALDGQRADRVLIERARAQHAESLRYQSGRTLTAPLKAELAEDLRGASFPLERVDDWDGALERVRVIEVTDGSLFGAHTNAAFVYVPLDTGLRVHTLAGYSHALAPGSPVGVDDVLANLPVGRANRVTVQGSVRVAVIPADVWRTHFARTVLSHEELVEAATWH